MSNVVVTGGDDSGVSAGVILGIVLVLLLIVIGIWYFGFGAPSAGGPPYASAPAASAGASY